MRTIKIERRVLKTFDTETCITISKKGTHIRKFTFNTIDYCLPNLKIGKVNKRGNGK